MVYSIYQDTLRTATRGMHFTRDEFWLVCVRPNHQVDSYDFHALDALQCMLERRNGGETGQLYSI